MSLLWFGGEDTSFPKNPPTTTTDGGYFRAGIARAAVYREPGGYALSKQFVGGGITAAWLSQYVYFQENPGDCRFAGLCNFASGNKGIYVGEVELKLTVWKFDGTTWTVLAQESVASATGNTLFKCDLQLVDYGASATLRLYKNATLVVEATGVNASISGVASFDCVCLPPNEGTLKTRLSEIIVSSTDTRILTLKTYELSGAGSTNGWNGAHTDIDEIVTSDADAIYTDTADKDFQAALGNSPAGSYAVDAVKIEVRSCKTGDAAIGSLKLGLLSGGVVDVDAGQSLATAWDTEERYMTTVNGGQFTPAILDACELNLRSAA